MKTSSKTQIPEELHSVLAADKTARAAFNAMPPSHQAEHIRYIAEAKKPETRARRAAASAKMSREWAAKRKK